MKPERRTRGDILAAAAIVVVIALVTLLIWWTSDARATVSRPAAAPAPNPSPAREVPGTLKQLWTANSPATRVPMVAGGTVATGAGRLVEGRNPTTGETLWSYSRDTDLCGVSWVYRYAVAVYRDDRGCGQVSTIDGSTGRRGPPAAATRTQRCGCPPMAPRCCRPAAPAWNCGGPTWFGCCPTARPTLG
ncbi:conserved alanine and valine rich domain protein [Mycobacterium ulcerans str. Harvey]|uniref:Conserved alanine and valine rich domain protein n=1 Tax=Mycobacterium ulcerans str. Harvey TaxID=1299332 RepID=A0ABP3AE54_MYCUL|nr:conserved alanine and valine rich domain protein [Mycobacterium ulcerans str. Harvey]